eukprot:7314215-Prymnesium_polylepis.1
MSGEHARFVPGRPPGSLVGVLGEAFRAGRLDCSKRVRGRCHAGAVLDGVACVFGNAHGLQLYRCISKRATWTLFLEASSARRSEASNLSARHRSGARKQTMKRKRKGKPSFITDVQNLLRNSDSKAAADMLEAMRSARERVPKRRARGPPRVRVLWHVVPDY